MIPGIDRKLTVMLNTVREDDQAGGTSPLVDLTAQLVLQDFPFSDMELVCVDGLHPYRVPPIDAPFRITHVAPRQTPAVRTKRCAISAYKNTGLSHARGELVITVDDCGILSDGYLQRTWEAWSERRECLSGLQKGIGAENLNDSRSACLNAEGKATSGFDMYGFAAFPLEFALYVNGYDEMFDGSQGLEDIDMGLRLKQAGCRLSLDRRHTFALTHQGGWSPRLFDGDVVVKCCNHTWEIQRRRGLMRANEHPWTAEDWALVAPRCYLLRDGGVCGYHGRPCAYLGVCADREHVGLRVLRDEPQVFDLAKLREEALGL